jgi:hypothetical protein
MNENNSYTLLLSSVSNLWGALHFERSSMVEISENNTKQKKNFFIFIVDVRVLSMMSRGTNKEKNEG